MEAAKINAFPDDYEHVKSTLEQFATPLLNKVLLALYRNTYTQSELAKHVDTTTRSLANTIHKLGDEDGRIIVKTKKGRSQFYSLSPAAKSYVEKTLLPDPVPEKTIHFNANAGKREILLQYLNMFQEFRDAAGSDWDICMMKLLEQQPYNYSSSVQKLFQDFYNETVRLFIEDTDILDKIHLSIGNALLSKLLFRKLEPLEGIRVLLKIERTHGPRFTNRLIESVFDSLEGRTGYDDELKNRARESITNTEYEQINNFIKHMISHLGEQTRNSSDIESILIRQYFISENAAVFLRIRYERYLHRNHNLFYF